jgi:hypothetical protein
MGSGQVDNQLVANSFWETSESPVSINASAQRNLDNFRRLMITADQLRVAEIP